MLQHFWQTERGWGFERAARKQRRRLQTQGMDLPADAWKRFPPDVVDAKRCQARA